jgi:hypothetical protein
MMAAEYSRELSTKVLIGLKNLAQHGFNCGARPGSGLRRMLVSKTAEPKQLLYEERKKRIDALYDQLYYPSAA